MRASLHACGTKWASRGAYHCLLQPDDVRSPRPLRCMYWDAKSSNGFPSKLLAKHARQRGVLLTGCRFNSPKRKQKPVMFWAGFGSKCMYPHFVARALISLRSGLSLAQNPSVLVSHPRHPVLHIQARFRRTRPVGRGPAMAWPLGVSSTTACSLLAPYTSRSTPLAASQPAFSAVTARSL